MPTALAISPHLDDAIFSAGGTLTRLSRQGWRVIVATVFTASVHDPRGFALACQLDKGLAADIDYMSLRRAEDAAACAIIGAEPLWLPFVEAPHRGYQSAGDLFSGLHSDDLIVGEIAPTLANLIRDTAPDEVFAPQAIGAHVDHVAVLQGLLLCGRHLSLWPDFPYTLRPGHRPSPFATAMDGLIQVNVDLEADERAAKSRAIARYASQVAFQFGGSAQIDSAVANSEERFRSYRHRDSAK